MGDVELARIEPRRFEDAWNILHRITRRDRDLLRPIDPGVEAGRNEHQPVWLAMAVISQPLSRGKAEAGARRIADHGEHRRGDLVV